jgi:hypothetical protein
MVQVLRRRVLTPLALALAALAATVLPGSPAHAAWGPAQSVYVQVDSNQFTLGWISGTVQFDDGTQAYTYSFTFCRVSSYTAPSMDVYVNGTYRNSVWHSGADKIPGCNFTAYAAETVAYGGVVHKVQFVLNGVGFSGQTATYYKSNGGGPNYGSSYGTYFSQYA